MDPRMYKITDSHDVIFLENQFLENQFLNSNTNQEKGEVQITLTSDETDEDDESPHQKKSIKEESEDDEFHESSDRMAIPETTTMTPLTDESGPRRSNRKWKPYQRRVCFVSNSRGK